MAETSDFPLFPKLPVEVRLQIWKGALPPPQIHSLHSSGERLTSNKVGTCALACINRESRQVFEENTTRTSSPIILMTENWFEGNSLVSGKDLPNVRYNLEKDLFYLACVASDIMSIVAMKERHCINDVEKFKGGVKQMALDFDCDTLYCKAIRDPNTDVEKTEAYQRQWFEKKLALIKDFTAVRELVLIVRAVNHPFSYHEDPYNMSMGRIGSKFNIAMTTIRPDIHGVTLKAPEKNDNPRYEDSIVLGRANSKRWFDGSEFLWSTESFFNKLLAERRREDPRFALERIVVLRQHVAWNKPSIYMGYELPQKPPCQEIFDGQDDGDDYNVTDEDGTTTDDDENDDDDESEQNTADESQQAET